MRSKRLTAVLLTAMTVMAAPLSAAAETTAAREIGPGITTEAQASAAGETCVDAPAEENVLVESGAAESAQAAAESAAAETTAAAETSQAAAESSAAGAAAAETSQAAAESSAAGTAATETTAETKADGRAVSEAEIDAFYADSVLVGDSVMLGFRNYAQKSGDPFLKSIGILCAGSFSMHNSFDPVSGKSVHPIYQGKQRHVWESIAMMGRKQVFLFFGLNDIALDNNTPALYQQLVARIKEQSPEAQIHIISMTYVAAGAGKKRLNNTNIRAFNATMKEIAAKEGWGFVNMADPLADGNGDLAKAYCSDNYVHQTPAAYKVWTGVLRAYAREVLSRQEAAK